jgi:all-trans-8'-apo-beta-carotenal 15,15'-oxygenase
MHCVRASGRHGLGLVTTPCCMLARRYVYATCSLHPGLNVPQQALGKVDLATGQTTTWSRGSRYYTGEPVFVPRARAPAAAKAGASPHMRLAKQQEQQSQQQGDQQHVQARDGQQQQQQGQKEDDGWLLSLCYDASRHASELVVLDAQRVADGPVATLHLSSPVPHGLHCSWVPTAPGS